jgi:hypothetical protein
MNKQVEKVVAELTSKAKGTSNEGHLLTVEDLNRLNSQLGNILPEWYMELFSTYPLSAMHLGYPQYEPEDDFDGYVQCEMATPQNIYDEMELCYPGIAIKGLGYFCFAVGMSGVGDQYFTTSKKGDNPPVYQVYHDVSEDGEIIEREGMIKVADSLSEFFTKARIDE